jgi:hypothetical protein
VYVGILGFIDDSQILRMSSLYHKTIKQNLFIIELKQKGIKPSIMGDKSYPLLPWLMVSHKQLKVHHIVFDDLYNQQLSHGKSVVENSFGS